MIKLKSIALLGTGHLGSALIRGFIKSGYPATSITISNRNPDKSARLVKELGVLSTQTNPQATEHSDVIILAVKPQSMQDICQEIGPTIQKKRPLVISLAGVIDIESIIHWLKNKDLLITRVMTNTPTEFCKGTSGLYANNLIPAEQKLWVESLFNQVGYTFWVDHESMLDTLTAPIGCAPAYVFLFLEALQNAAMDRGISRDLAEKITLESVLGAAELAKKSGRSFADLRAGVTTPHGVTDHSLQKLSFTDFFNIFKRIYAGAEERIIQIIKTLQL
ncbi:MAG: pyrroline-5-carboxylate reductase [Legionella longbeachae]|nr:pyrroline-5-carboxylate reductase [Legionella longbeachae]